MNKPKLDILLAIDARISSGRESGAAQLNKDRRVLKRAGDEIERLRNELRIIARQEREACAAICDLKWMAESYCGLTARACAEEIRARGDS